MRLIIYFFLLTCIILNCFLTSCSNPNEKPATTIIADITKVQTIVPPKKDSVINIQKDSIKIPVKDTNEIKEIKTIKRIKKVKNPFKKLDYNKVVAYDYDHGKYEPGILIIMNGKLAPTVKKQKELTKDQIDNFINFIGAPSTYGEGKAFCFDPHLGVVFYKNDTIVAHLSICLECNYLYSSINIPATEVEKISIGDDFEYPAEGFSKSGRQNISTLCEQLNFSHCEDIR